MEILINKIKFKNENLKNWEINTNYWLNNSLRQVEDTKSFFKKKLRDLISSNMTVVDMGCGSAWLLDFLLENKKPVNYIGLDFNIKFIKHLKEKYSNTKNAIFYHLDFEKSIPKKLLLKADIIFNCFNFFEIGNLDLAFENGIKMLKVDGKLIIFTIEYVYLILALSNNNMECFKYNLKLYETIKSKGKVPYFFQNIDLGDSESDKLKYASVLYSFDDYYKQANKNNMKLIDYSEVVKTSKFLPKTYQYIVFNK